MLQFGFGSLRASRWRIFLTVAWCVSLLASSMDWIDHCPQVQWLDPGRLEQLNIDERSFFGERYGIPKLDLSHERDPSLMHLLTLVLQKGYVDFTGHLCEEESCIRAIDPDLRRQLRKLVEIIRTSALGEIYGNKRLVEAVALTHIVSNGTEGQQVGEMWPRIQQLEAQSLLALFRSTRSEKATSQCLQALTAEANDETQSRPISTCRACENILTCRIVNNLFAEVFHVRLDLAMPSVPLQHIVDLPGVRILSVAGEFSTSFVEWMSHIFPHVRVLDLTRAQILQTSRNKYPLAVKPWVTSVHGLSVDYSPESPNLLCMLENLRHLKLQGHWRTLPACLGSLNQLTELNVVNVGLTGHSAVPPELAGLNNLRSFHAFTQGRSDGCPPRPITWQPPADGPQQEKCVPGYPFSIRDQDNPEWRCPWNGWFMRLDDAHAPWWRWESIERFHVDANFWYGSIPSYLPDRWPRLRSLDLHDNLLSGALPTSLLKLQNLTQLQLQHNNFECKLGEQDVVAQLFELPRIRTLNLDQNPRLCGCAPNSSTLEAQVGGTMIKVGSCRSLQEL